MKNSNLHFRIKVVIVLSVALSGSVNLLAKNNANTVVKVLTRGAQL
jgi:hypothetical protein